MFSHRAHPNQLDLSADFLIFQDDIFLLIAQRTGHSQGEEEGMEWVGTRVAWQRQKAEDVARQQEAVHMRKETHSYSNKSIRNRGQGHLLAPLVPTTENMFLE